MDDGSAFALDGIVVVTHQLPSGAAGVLRAPRAHERRRPEPSRSSNFALMDQLAALRWVKTNIHAFGGDASNVTIFGESAGGVDILTLLTIPDATGLFQKAIVESAGFVAHSVALEAGRTSGGRDCPSCWCEERVGPAAPSAYDVGADQRQGRDRRADRGRTLVEDRPVSQFATGRFLHVSLMIGNNSDEGSAIEGATPSDVPGTFTASEIDSLRKAYGGLNDACPRACGLQGSQLCIAEPMDRRTRAPPRRRPTCIASPICAAVSAAACQAPRTVPRSPTSSIRGNNRHRAARCCPRRIEPKPRAVRAPGRVCEDRYAAGTGRAGVASVRRFAR